MRVQLRSACEVWMKLRSTMSCAHLADRHNLAAEAIGARAGVPWKQASKAASHSMPQKFLPIFRRADSAHPAEHPCKVLLRFEPAGHRDVQNTRLGGAQHFLGTLYPMTENKLMRGFAG